MSSDQDEPVQRSGRLGVAWRYGLAALISLVAWGAPVVGAGERETDPVLMWFLVGDPLLGLVSFGLIRWRHRRRDDR